MKFLDARISKTQKNILVAYLLLAFFWGAGFHNFYLRQWKLGLLQLAIWLNAQISFLLVVFTKPGNRGRVIDFLTSDRWYSVTSLSLFLLIGLVIRDVFVIPNVVRKNAEMDRQNAII